MAALHEADKFIAAHPDQAAAICLNAAHSKLSSALIRQCLAEPQMAYSTAPSNRGGLSDFLARVGMIKQKPASWKDLFFPEITDEQGS